MKIAHRLAGCHTFVSVDQSQLTATGHCAHLSKSAAIILLDDHGPSLFLKQRS